MGQKTVRFSDLSGQLITEDDALARIVVHDHPELGDSPVEFEALTDEAKVIEKAALRVAIVELHVPGEDEPRRVVVDAATFDELATDTPMNELLITARPARPARRASKTTSGAASSTSNSTSTSTSGGRVNYATLEHAGEPHKGKTTDLEKQLVRNHFDEINDRLETIMTRSYRALREKSLEHETNLRMGSYLLAVARVARPEAPVLLRR